jgi:ABC-type glycerol-3-phosphate transport system substrate-binding protein
MANSPIQELPSSRFSRRRFLAGTGAAAGAVVLGRAPAAIGQQVRELQVWHTEVEPQTVKAIQDTSIAEFEKKFPGFKIKQQALGWGDLNTKLLAALAAGSPPDLTHLNPFMTASLYTKNLLRPMDELIRSLGENDIHEATRKLQFFDGKYYGITHAMGATYFCERRDLRVKKGIKAPETYDDMLKLCAALTEDGRMAFQMPGEKLYMGFVHPAEWLAGNGGSWVDPKTWRPQLNGKSMLEILDYLQKLNKFQSQGWSGQKYLDTQAALATGKIAMSYLSGARAIGYIEKYAPENMRDPEHFMPLLRPHGPSGNVGARRRELGRVQPVQVPQRGLRVPAALLQEGALPPVLPLGADPPHPDLLLDAQRPRLPRQRADQEVEGVARGDADRAQGQPLPAARLHPA